MVPAVPFGDASEPVSWLVAQTGGPEAAVVELVGATDEDVVVVEDEDVEEAAVVDVVVAGTAAGWCDDEQPASTAAVPRQARVSDSLILPP